MNKTKEAEVWKSIAKRIEDDITEYERTKKWPDHSFTGLCGRVNNAYNLNQIIFIEYHEMIFHLKSLYLDDSQVWNGYYFNSPHASYYWLSDGWPSFHNVEAHNERILGALFLSELVKEGFFEGEL